MARQLPRHLATYAHHCPLLGRAVGLEKAIRWSPVSRRPARHRPPTCPVCGVPMTLETTSYQAAADDAWDNELERTRLILEGLTETEREVN